MPKDQEDEFAHELAKLSDQLIGIAQSTLTLAMQLKLSSSPSKLNVSGPPSLSKLQRQTTSCDNSNVLMSRQVSKTMISETSIAPPAPSKIEKSGVLTRGDSTVSLTRTVSTTMLYDTGSRTKRTESLDILTDFTHGNTLFSTNFEDTTDEFLGPISMAQLYASHGRTRNHSSCNDILQPARGKECRRTVGKSAQKTPFRFRILRLMAAASWPNEKDFSIAPAIVEEMNADLKDPATSMKKRMKQRDFYLVDETKDMITWRHPKLSAHTWKQMVGTLR